MQEIIIRAVCWTLLHSLWQGLLLAAGAAILMMLTRQSGSALRYKLLCSLLIIFVAGVSFTFFRQINISINPAVAIKAVATFSEQSKATNQPSAGNLVFTDSIQKITGTVIFYFNQYSWLLVLIWFFLFLYHFVKLLLGMVNAERMRYYKTNIVSDEWNQKLEELSARLHIQQSILFMESALLKVPVLIGYIKPVILIPVGMLSQLSTEQVEAILLHELAHVKRHDYLVNLIQNAVDTIFFFNPAVLWISSLLRSERENCCDDIAISETRSRKQFVEALVSFNQYSNTINSTYSLSWVAGKGQLLQRVQRIVTRKNNSVRSGELLILMVVLLMTGSAFITLRHTGIHLNQTPDPIIRTAGADTAAPPVKPFHKAAVSQIEKPKLVKKPIKVSAVAVPVPAPVVEPVEIQDAEPVEIVADEPDDNDLGHLQKQLGALGYKENDLGMLRTYRDHGVTAEYVQSLLSLGYHNISLHEMMQFKDHGVHTEFIGALKKQGFGIVSLEEAMTLVDHGVSTYFIESFKQLGFKNISLEQAMALKDHGVNSTFIEAFKKKTGNYLLLEDYIKLKDSGISPV
jgi:bla regulator protein blaR1